MKLEIYIENEIDLLDFEDRWYINNVYVKKNNKFYNMNIFYKERLFQEINESSQLNEPFAIEPIDMPTKDNLIHTLLEQDKYYFYERLKECEVIDDEIIYQMSDAQIKSSLNNHLPTSIKINKLYKIY